MVTIEKLKSHLESFIEIMSSAVSKIYMDRDPNFNLMLSLKQKDFGI